MSLRSIARGAAVASSVVMLSGYVWYRSGAGTERAAGAALAEAPPPARETTDREIMYGSKSGGMVVQMDLQVKPPANPFFEKNAGTGDLTLVDAAFASAEGDPGTAQPKAGYVFGVLTGQGSSGPGGTKTYVVAGVMGSSKSMTLGYALPPQPAPVDQKRTMMLSGSKSERVVFLDPPSAGEAAPAKPSEPKRTTMLSGSKSERMVFLDPPSAGEAAPAKPPEPKRRVLMPGSKSPDLLPDSAMPDAMVQSRKAPESPAAQEAPPAPAKKKRRVLMSSSKSKPVEWVDVEDEKTDAPPQQQEQRRAGEDGK